MLCANDSYQSLAEIARLGSLLYHAAASRRTEPTRRAEEARRRPRHRGISPARASRRFDSRACSMLEAVGAKRLMRPSIEVAGSDQACTHSPREMHPRPALARRASCACSRCRRSPRRRRASNLHASSARRKECAEQRTLARHARTHPELRVTGTMRKPAVLCCSTVAHVATCRVQQRLLERKAPTRSFPTLRLRRLIRMATLEVRHGEVFIVLPDNCADGVIT